MLDRLVLKRLVCVFALALGMALASSANAQVVLTFAAKRAAGPGDFPHSIVRIDGVTESGETIHRAFGYMPVEQSLGMMLGGRVAGAVLEKNETFPWELVTPYLSIQIPDTALDAVIERFQYWNGNENGGYDFFSQNCIAFLADLTRTIGLVVPQGDHLSPAGFLSDLAALNPPGSHPGILATPLPNPAPGDIPAERPEAAGSEVPPRERPATLTASDPASAGPVRTSH
jgi:hypothetical protein